MKRTTKGLDMRLRNNCFFNSSLLLVTLMAGLVGCASVSVSKLDRTSGKVVPGTAEGVRFYLPRPYVSVFEPFIVASDTYLAKGELSADGNYVLLTQVPQGLDSLVNLGLRNNAVQTMGKIAIDSSTVVARTSLPSGPHGVSAANGSATNSGQPEETKKDEKGKSADEEKAGDSKAGDTGKSTTGQTAGGILNYKATNDNAAYAVTPQPRYFNILWMPDFDEQYVVTAKAGLGNAGVTINLGQSWSLQGLDATVDNSAVVKPLLDFYSGVLGSLQKIATAKIEGPLAALTGGPQGAAVDKTAKTEFEGGTPVTVKVTKVRIVAPGLYPILKPKEMDGLSLTADEQKRILTPKPPLTNIAFNTYDAIVIEAARSTGDTALRIHQYVDSTTGGAPPEVKPASKPNSDADLMSGKAALNKELSDPKNVTTGGEYYVADLKRDGTVVKVTLTKRTGGSNGTLASVPEDAVTKKLVVTTLKANGIGVIESNIQIP